MSEKLANVIKGMRRLALTMVCCLLALSCLLQAAEEAEPQQNQEPDRMEWWREARFGMFIHWGLYSVAGGEWDGTRGNLIASWLQHEFRIPTDEYAAALLPGFTAQNYDPAAWAQLAKRAGMKYAVFTSKHHEGFSLFDSAHSEFDVMATPAKRDVTRDYLEAFHNAGLKAGLYFSVIDWHHPEYPVAGDPIHPMRDNPEYIAQDRDLAKYVDFMHQQVEELVSGYGSIDILWWDFGYDPIQGEALRATDLVNMVRTNQPQVIMNNRLYVGAENPNGDFATPEQNIPPNGLPGLDWEVCMTINDTWGYKPHDLNFKSSTELIHNLVDIVSKGGNYLLNVGARPDGTIPAALVERLEDIGDWMAVNGEAIYGTTASPFATSLPWGRVTSKDTGGETTRLYLHVFEWPENGQLTCPKPATEVVDVHMLDGGTPVPFDTTSGEAVLQLPSATPDPAATVLVMEIERPPRMSVYAHYRMGDDEDLPLAISKLGTIDQHMVETTPIVFNGRLYRFESVRPNHEDNPDGTPYFRFVDVETGEHLPAFGNNHALGSAYSEDGTMYVFGVPAWGAESIDMFWSQDLENWQSKTIIQLPGWTLFNTTVCKADGRYVMSFEVGDPPSVVGTRFTNLFAESADLMDWTVLSHDHIFTQAHYSACPSLRYLDGMFYMTYLHSQPDYNFETRLVRSADLIDWEPSPLNPILKASAEDKQIANSDLTAAQRAEIANALNRNNSDVDFCEFNGEVVIYYSWGDQVGNEFLAEARYPGTLEQFLQNFYTAKGFPRDSSGNGRHMRLSGPGAPTRTPSGGPTDDAFYSFDGSTDYFYGTEADWNPPSDNVGVEVWVRTSNLAQLDTHIFGLFANTMGIHLGYNAADDRGWYGAVAGVSFVGVQGLANYTSDEWIHLAIVRASGITTFYVNGSAVASSAAAPLQSGGSSDLHMAVTDGGAVKFDGDIADARIFTFREEEFDPAKDLLVNSGALAGYYVWSAQYDGADIDDPTADTNSNGVPNGIEYVLGGDPAVQTASAWRPGFDTDGKPDHALYAYPLSRLASDDPELSVTVRYSTDLQNWISAVHDPEGSGISIEEVAAPSGDHSVVTVAFPMSLAVNDKLFAMLRAIFGMAP